METDLKRMSDEDLVALAQAERVAGIPDQQTASVAAEAKIRLAQGGNSNEVEASD